MTLTSAKPAAILSVLAAGAVLVTLAVGAAQLLRGSDPVFVRNIPMTAVRLADGRTLTVLTREVTVAQWQACHRAGKCALDLSAQERDVDFPATGLSYPDAMQFANWLNSLGKMEWRLPTSAEWHELASEVLPEKPDPIFTDPSLTWASAYLLEASRTGRSLRPSGAFSATSAGIQDLDGNVWEWTQDCYAGAEGQGATLDADRCPAFIMGGEHEAVMAYLVRDPARGGCAVGAPPAHLGMRLVADGS